jgi:hypothetical protein
MADTLKQHRTLRNIIVSLEKTLKEDYHSNEATLKHNFFYHLRKLNTEHLITVEENLSNHINYNGRADFFLADTETKSHRSNVAIEFKINCLNSKLIKHDIAKLEGMKALNPLLATIFIDFFTMPLNFGELLKISSSFEAANKVYSIFIAPSVDNFYYHEDGEILKYKLNKPTIVTTSARLLEQCIIPSNIPTIRLPTEKSMLKFISLCLKPKTIKHLANNEYIKYFELEKVLGARR